MSEAGLLTLTQWLSPAFPLGSFAYSHGLEAAIVAGEVRNADALRTWLTDVLERGSGRVDAILLAEALKPEADHAALAATARALAASSERWTETEEQGRALTDTVNALTGADREPYPLPVALGAAAAGLDLPAVRVATLYLHAFASNLVLAAVRFVPLGQTEGQRVLSDLRPVIEAVATRAVAEGLAGLGSAAVGADMAAMRHETMDVRIFRT